MPVELAQLEPPVCLKSDQPFFPLDSQKDLDGLAAGETITAICPADCKVNISSATVEGDSYIVYQCSGCRISPFGGTDVDWTWND